MRLIRVWFVVHLSLTVPSVVHMFGELLDTAKVCLYMQCTKEGSKLTLLFNETMWKAFTPQPNSAFDFSSFNWSELDSLVQENQTFEVVFNRLVIPHIDKLQGHESVTTLNLENNCISTIEVEAFENFINLITLSLRGNMITQVHDFVDYPNNLQHLDLSNNSIKDIVRLKTFTLPHLRHLNLSHNRIESIRTELSKLEALETLDLSHNAIKRGEKPIVLPPNVRQLLLQHNELTTWPFESVPETLTELSLRFNQIDQIARQTTNVRSLDLSSNRLAIFPGEYFPLLEELDLSSNYFEEFPRFGNQTKSIGKISFNRMPNLRSIGRSTFAAIADNLQELEISFCPRLATIEPNTFIDLKALNRLDLSYNALQQVPENMAHWQQIEHGVDLQGNPINCNCSMQWLADRVIPAMHSRPELHKLFPMLRCAQPPMYQNYLIVHLTVHDNLMCRKYREMDLPGMETVVQAMKEHRQMQVVWAQKIILSCLIVGIILMGCYLAYLKHKYPRHRIRPLYYK
ncbi:leucine-rich repeat-containing protein 15-like [Anopheles marshallii]|uniref:leucine-rich repeat-containing protein 15-like n=1 Tax=Anopheles marshallii TaxID=1521116 RepID=UPI00237A6376|nr:leucine-rich repeat-containing protein 15-like [Anopheles marshallii]